MERAEVKSKRAEAEAEVKKAKREKYSIERLIVRGMINSTEYLKTIRPLWNDSILKSDEARRISYWCIEYFDKYTEAPSRAIEDIYFDKKKSGEIREDEAEGVKDDVEEFAYEYDEPFNADYAIDQTKQYIKERYLEEHFQEAHDFLRNDDFEGAEDLLLNYKPWDGSNGSELEKIIHTSDEFCIRDIAKPPTLIWPWLSEKSYNMIYGWRGSGKTWLGLLMAVALTRKNTGELPDIGPWKIRKTASTLYVDAELGNYFFKERLNELCKALPPEDPKKPLYILTGDDYANEFDKSLNLNKQIQEAIENKVKQNPEIKVMILDNASALTPGVDENSKDPWDPYSQWMVFMKNKGLAVILVHHSGKNKEAGSRGSSSREDPLDYAYEVREHKDHKDGDYAWFTVMAKKFRNLRPGEPKHDFSLRIVDSEKGGLTWEQDDTGEVSDKTKEIILDILCERGSMQEIGNRHGVTKQHVHKLKTKRCVSMRLIVKNKKDKWELTEKGDDFIEQYG